MRSAAATASISSVSPALLVVLALAPGFLANPLPGAPPPPPELVRELEAAWRARPAGAAPRTRHRNPDGTPKYSNRLLLSPSPYLQQHAHNPVNWYPWGDEAFETARRLGRPVLLSVGYSTCHWCHVMEEESFEDEEIARLLNERYVAIKVDREERPDVDALYMTAVLALTGGGGWPMTVWLTPDRQPFYGGTYFPARDGERGIRMGFLTVLSKVNEVYRNEPGQVAASAESLTAHLRQSLAAPTPGDGLPGEIVLQRAAEQCAERFDADNGGTLGAPKFPSTMPVRFLLRRSARGDAHALEMATRTLAGMAAGGIHDQVGGGFHRYATDARWRVPHFEKMLYDNALLALAYLEAYQATGDADFARVARDILRWLERDMTAPEGAFFSATDADSPAPDGRREEGWFFTWTPAEIDAALEPASSRLVKAFYAVTPEGNFEGRNVLHTPRPLAAVAAEQGLSEAQARILLDAARERLYAARAKRPPPLRDEKILVAWNGLAISALARASQIWSSAVPAALDEDPRAEAAPSSPSPSGSPPPGQAYATAAARAADFILTRMQTGGRLRRSFAAGQARHDAYLEDYAFFIAGLLDLYEATGEPRWLGEAIRLDAVLARHYERESGGFHRTAGDQEALLARETPADDGAEPSGNSVQALNLLRLAELTGDDAYRRRGERAQQAFGGLLARDPLALAEMLLAVDFRTGRPRQILLVAPSSLAELEPFLRILGTRFVPNRVLAQTAGGPPLARAATHVPMLTGKIARGGKPTAYVCEKQVCALPTSDPAVFAKQLGEGR